MRTDEHIGHLLQVAEVHGVQQVRRLDADEVAKLPKDHGTVSKAVCGQAQIEGKQVSITVAVPERFPYALPLVFIDPWDKLGVIPHVGDDGYVCTSHSQGLLLDTRRPREIIAETLGKALRQLRRGVRRENHADFADEFDAYWSRQKGIQIVSSYVTPTAEPRLVDAYMKGTDYHYVCDQLDDVVAYHSGGNLEPLTKRNAVYVPLKPGAVLVPPHPQHPWSSEQTTAHLLRCVHEPLLDRVTKLTRKLSLQDALVVAHLPRASGGGGTLFGVRYRGHGDTRPLAIGTSSVEPVRFIRRERDFVVPRGGGRTILGTKRVALIGCGSVGGFLALELARAGIQRFTLVDPDSMAVENTYRHVLGRGCVGEKKTTALKKHMEQTLPYLQVEAIDQRIEDALATGTFDASRFDAILVALGNPPVELYLNRVAHAQPNRFPPVVFAWVEAFGIGGHVVLCSNRNSGRHAFGCLECLYTPLPNDVAGLSCRASFAEAGQDFGRNTTGCAGLFTPYGSATAVRAALAATEVVVDLFEGREPGNPLVSFKGSAADFLAEGLSLTARHACSDDELRGQRYAYANPICPVCGGRG